MNLEKHVKTAAAQLAEAESSLVPTCARGTHLVDRYIKGRRVDQHTNRRAVASAPPPFVLRLDQLPATPVSQERIRKRVEGINRQLRQLKLPVRLRMV